MTGKGTDLEGDLEHIAGQERRLRFERFDAGTAWDLGSRLKATAEAKGAALVIDVSLCGRQLFHYAMPGTTPRQRGLGAPQAQYSTALPPQLLRSRALVSAWTFLPNRRRTVETSDSS